MSDDNKPFDFTQISDNIRECNNFLEKIEKRTMSHSRQLDSLSHRLDEQNHDVSAIASGIGEIVKTNAESMRIIAGKKQVPLSVFMFIMGIFAVGFFVVLVALARVQLVIKPGTVIVNPEGEKVPNSKVEGWSTPSIEIRRIEDGPSK